MEVKSYVYYNSIPFKFTAGINKIDNKLCWMTFSVVK